MSDGSWVAHSSYAQASTAQIQLPPRRHDTLQGGEPLPGRTPARELRFIDSIPARTHQSIVCGRAGRQVMVAKPPRGAGLRAGIMTGTGRHAWTGVPV